VSDAGKAQIGLFRATMLVAGNMIGSGIFLMPAAMAQIGGVALLGWAIAVPCAMLLALVFARLATTNPLPGGPYAWARWRLGNYAGFQSNALYWLGNIVANVAIAVSVIGYASAFFSPLAGPTAAAVGTIAVIWLAVLANIAGPRLVASLESATTLLGLAPVLIITLLGWFWFHPQLFSENWDPSAIPVHQAVPGALTLMFWAFTGVESAAVATDVVRNPEKNVARATLLGVLISAVVYVGSTAVLFGIVPAGDLATSAAPFELAVHSVLGAGAALLMAFCAMMKAAGALGGWTLLVAESGRVASQDGLFVKALGRVDRRRVPVLGLVVIGILMTVIEFVTLAPTLGNLFGRLVSMSTLMLIPAYLYSSVALGLSPGERPLMRGVGFVAAVSLVYIASTAQAEDALLAFVLVLATAPLFIVNRRRAREDTEILPGEEGV
jgi:arginine:agmatine antiporter